MFQASPGGRLQHHSWRMCGVGEVVYQNYGQGQIVIQIVAGN
jgi:hypothetical protein